jgi:hypothetical protein
MAQARSVLRWGMTGAALLLAACGDSTTPPVVMPTIPFAPVEDAALKDPDNPAKKFRVDFARVEFEFPLSRADRMKLTPQIVAQMSQEQVDQVYGRLTAGPIPDGAYKGDLFFSAGDKMQSRLDEILGGIGGRIAADQLDLLDKIGTALWKGKVFYRDKRELRNLISNSPVMLPLVGDPTTIKYRTSIPREGWLGSILPKNEVWLLFPAKLYCGQSLLDGRRESIIVDYNYGEEIDGYRPKPDDLAARGGLKIRDEIRMVRPGFYLGRAYTNRMFLLNFTVYNEEVAEKGKADFLAGKPIAEDCWPGEASLRAAAR